MPHALARCILVRITLVRMLFVVCDACVLRQLRQCGVELGHGACSFGLKLSGLQMFSSDCSRAVVTRPSNWGGLAFVPAFDSNACDCRCAFRAVNFVPAKALRFTLQQRHFIKGVFLCFGRVARNDASLQSSPKRQFDSESNIRRHPCDGHGKIYLFQNLQRCSRRDAVGNCIE